MSKRGQDPAYPGQIKSRQYLVNLGFAERHPEAAKEISELPPVQCDGLSKREYFAAKAPREIPSWFEPKMKGEAPPLEPVDIYKKWETEWMRQRYFQWPWAWADGVLAALEGEEEKV